MSLEAFAAVAEIVNALAVTLTLIVLIVSIRQNTKAQRVVAVESITAAITAINVPAMESPALGNALASALRDWNAASRDERILAHYFLFSFFKLCEQAWYQQKSQALDAGQWAGWENSLLRFYHSPGAATGWWPGRRFAYSPAFREFLAKSEPPATTAGSSLYDLFEGTAPAAELAPSPQPESGA
ncbi:MAG: hypothetical protein WD076_05035 [Parvularculaceae bacterium]